MEWFKIKWQQTRKAAWFALGLFMLGLAYVGLVTPGIPWSTPTVAAAFCFAKSNKRWHDWLMNHKIFGPFLSQWGSHRVFPRRAKWAMVITMDVSIVMLWIMTQNIWLVLGVGVIMVLVSVWAWRFPESMPEAEQRVREGKKLGWFGRW